MLNINFENDFYVPKIAYELFEYDYNIIEHGKKLKKDECMIWLPISFNENFAENKLPNVLYIVFSDIEIESQNKQISSLKFNESILNMLKYVRYCNEFTKFYIDSYVTYIENRNDNKLNFLNSIRNKLNVPFKYINEEEYIFENKHLLRNNENIPLIKCNIMYSIDKNDEYKNLFEDLKKYVIYDNYVYEKVDDKSNMHIHSCSIHELKNIITEKYSITHNLSSFILRYINILSYPINSFIFEFKNFYIDYISKIVYLKNDEDYDFFKKRNVKTLKNVNIKNFHFFDSFTTKDYHECFSKDLHRLINIIFDYLYHNRKLILKGDIILYNFIKRFLNKILKNNIVIFIENHQNIFYRKLNSENTFTILYNKDTDIFDIDLKIEGFKNTNLNHNKTLSLLLSSFLHND